MVKVEFFTSLSLINGCYQLLQTFDIKTFNIIVHSQLKTQTSYRYFVHILIYFGNLISNHWNFFPILHYSEEKEKYSNFDWTSTAWERAPNALGPWDYCFQKVFIGENKNIKLESLLGNLLRNVSKQEDRKKGHSSRDFSLFSYSCQNQSQAPRRDLLTLQKLFAE